MEYVILGFLMMRDLSQYDILKALQREVSPFYSASLGSIQTRLKKLEKEGYVTCMKIIENGRAKNVYSINHAGREHFNNWMMDEVDESKLEAQISSKVFFLGLMDREQRVVIIDGFINVLDSILEKFEAVNVEAVNTVNAVEDKYKEIFYYQLKTLNLGLVSIRTY